MTEKRFGFEMDKNCYKCIADIRDKKLYTDKKQVIDLLNELNDKCDFLEIENEALEQGATKYAELYHKSLKENEQLKDKYNEQSVEYEGLEEQVERLLDFKDKVFNLINKKLKKADKGFEQSYDSWYQGQVDVLKELKKELQMND